MLEVGLKIGPYEILGPLGVGGMGEVFRARDTRLRRDVALKVLPPSVAADEDRLRRFELEAQATGKLNHPNILAVYDFGTTETGSPYLVSELLEGENLRSRLASGPIPARKVIEYALQMAHGLAAAHESGIVHRDLKPENIFVTRDGRVKILDFGLAKLMPENPATAVASAGRARAQTLVLRTEPGALLGTVDYMSPEQIRALPVDARSDLFSFGAILYEMLSAKRPFVADSGVETLYAILEADPPALSQTNRSISPALERVVFHALEKNPEERFQSARDLAFHLRAISEPSGPSGIPELPPVRRRHKRVMQVALPVLAVVAAAVAFWAGQRTDQTSIPSFHPLTFRRGTITAARFAPDGRTTFYSAAWDGRTSELFTTRPESPESRALTMPGTELFGVSSTGEMAVKLDSQSYRPFTRSGTLARVALAGGAPRALAEDVHWADWSPDGELAIVRDAETVNQLEYPIGNVLHRTGGGWISHVRVSRTGDHVAFVSHPIRGDDGGVIAIVDREGKRVAEAGSWISAQGLAWSAGGDEVWFTATKVGMARAVHALSLGGDVRLVARVPGTLTLHDVAADGRVLLSHDDYRMRVSFRGPDDAYERDLSWLDWSLARHLSADGSTLLFDETGEGAGSAYSVYMRKTDGSPAVRLGDGVAMALSPDKAWALAFDRKTHDVVLLPTGPGDPRTVTTTLETIHWGAWFPDGKRLLVYGSIETEHPRFYVHDLETGESKSISREANASGMTAISPDGAWVAIRDFTNGLTLLPVDGGEPRRGYDLSSAHVPVRFSDDGRCLYLYERGTVPARMVQLDIESGEVNPWKEIAPTDCAGLMAVSPLLVTPDGRSYAYSYARILSNLYLVEGL